jgi:ribonuclease HI
LNGRVAALNRFISRSTERSLPFFKALKGKGKIEWGPEQSKAFAELKAYIEKMAILSPPLPPEPLFLYVAASKAAVSVALVREVMVKKGNIKALFILSQKLCMAPNYCTRNWRRFLMQWLWPQESLDTTLKHTESLCSLISLSMICSSTRRLRPESPNGQLSYQSIQLIWEKVGNQVPSFGRFCRRLDLIKQSVGDEELVHVWEIRCDRAWGRKGAGIATIITSPVGVKLRYASRLDYSDPSDRCTNNTTKHEVLLLSLRNVRALGANNFLVKCDAEVIKDHVEKESEAKEPKLVKYLTEVRKMERLFRGFTIEHLPGKRNGEADELAKKATRGEAMPPDLFFEILTAPSIRPDKQPHNTVNAIASLDWRAPIITFLRGHYEPVKTHDLKRMQARARGYVLKDDSPFKLGVCAPLLKCTT